MKAGALKIKTVVMSDNEIIVEKVNKLNNLLEALTFHNDKSANHRMIIKAVSAFGGRAARNRA